MDVLIIFLIILIIGFFAIFAMDKDIKILNNKQLKNTDGMRTYTVDKMLYTIPTEEAIDDVKFFMEIYFDSPEDLFRIWLRWAILHGPQLIEPTIKHFRTLSDPDMPESYVEDIIQEFNERFKLQLFKIQNDRFKLLRTDKVSREFNRKVSLRNSITINDIDEMSGIEFEQFLCKLFKDEGYNIATTPVTHDQGADLIVEQGGDRIVVQAKRYTANVSNSAIQEVVAAKALYNCKYAICITNSYFTKSAQTLAKFNSVILYDRDKLEQKLAGYNASLLTSTED